MYIAIRFNNAKGLLLFRWRVCVKNVSYAALFLHLNYFLPNMRITDAIPW